MVDKSVWHVISISLMLSAYETCHGCGIKATIEFLFDDYNLLIGFSRKNNY